MDKIKKRWKTVICNTGKKCWCRLIMTEDAVNDDLEYCVAPSGSIEKELAEHIVKLHNDWLLLQKGSYHDVEDFYKE